MRIQEKIDELQGYLKEVKEYLPEDFENYKGMTKRSVERALQLSIECVIDIANLMVKKKKLGVPSEEEDVFEKLEEEGIISTEMKNTLTSMKGFRNYIIHKYGKVNDEKSYEFANNKLEDFDKFIEAIKEELAKE